MNVPEFWANGAAECLSCGWQWVAVWPIGADPLECKQCGSVDTTRQVSNEAEQ